MDGEVLSRKEKLALWRAGRENCTTSGSIQNNSNNGGLAGVLAARPGGANIVRKKIEAQGKRKKKAQRKPFEVDTRIVQAAGERRIAPGTPIHALKKRLRRVEANPRIEPADKPVQKGLAQATTLVAAHRKRKPATIALQSRRKDDAIKDTLDAARMKQVSDYLKSQISEANMLLEIAGVDAARTLLSDMVLCQGPAKGVGELALYWAARAKIEEDAGLYETARDLLDEGQAFISIPTQQKVIVKVIGAFESRMDKRAEAEVAQLLDDSTNDSMNSTAQSNSPTSSTPYRYDPNDASMADEESGDSNPSSAIKNLNFSRVAIVDSEAPGSSGSSDKLSGVVFSDDDSDSSIGDIDPAVLARAEAFAKEEADRQIRSAVRDGEDLQDSKAGIEVSDEGDNTETCSGCSTKEAGVVPGNGNENKACASDTQEDNRMLPDRPDGRTSMAPPAARPSRRRKGTPHPKKDALSNSDSMDSSPGSFIVQVAKKGKDGNRTLTPVRRSRRISDTSREPTPSPLRKEMEAML